MVVKVSSEMLSWIVFLIIGIVVLFLFAGMGQQLIKLGLDMFESFMFWILHIFGAPRPPIEF